MKDIDRNKNFIFTNHRKNLFFIFILDANRIICTWYSRAERKIKSFRIFWIVIGPRARPTYTGMIYEWEYNDFENTLPKIS